MKVVKDEYGLDELGTRAFITFASRPTKSTRQILPNMTRKFKFKSHHIPTPYLSPSPCLLPSRTSPTSPTVPSSTPLACTILPMLILSRPLYLSISIPHRTTSSPLVPPPLVRTGLIH